MSHLVRYQFSGIAEYCEWNACYRTLYDQLCHGNAPNIIIFLYFVANHFQDMHAFTERNGYMSKVYLLLEINQFLFIVFKVSLLNILQQLYLLSQSLTVKVRVQLSEEYGCIIYLQSWSEISQNSFLSPAIAQNYLNLDIYTKEKLSQFLTRNVLLYFLYTLFNKF